MAESTTNRIKVSRWSQDTDSFTRSQMDASHANIETYAAKFTSGSSDPSLPDADYDRALFFNTTSSVLKFCPSDAATSWIEIPVGSDFVRLNATQTLTNKTLTSPTISSVVNSGTVSFPTSTDTLVGRNTTDTLTNKTLTEPLLNYPTLVAPEEKWNVVAGGPASTQNIDVSTASAWLYGTEPSANFVLNIRASSTATLSSILPTGHSITVAVAVTNSTSPKYMTSIQVDGTTTGVTTAWQGGNIPTSGNSSAIDIYSFAIVRTSSTPTYTIFASQTQFA